MSYKAPEKKREYNREYNREYYKKNREKNRDRIAERNREYYRKNRDKLTEYRRKYQKEYYEKNCDRIAKRNREYYRKNRDKLTEYRRKYQKENHVSIKIKSENYTRRCKDAIPNPKTGRYTDGEVIYLVKNANELTHLYMAIVLNRSASSVQSKIQRLRKAGLIE